MDREINKGGEGRRKTPNNFSAWGRNMISRLVSSYFIFLITRTHLFPDVQKNKMKKPMFVTNTWCYIQHPNFWPGHTHEAHTIVCSKLATTTTECILVHLQCTLVHVQCTSF